MRRLIIVFFALGMILGLSNIKDADAATYSYFDQIIVNGTSNACINWNDCVHEAPAFESDVLWMTFDRAGAHTFEIASGAWNSPLNPVTGGSYGMGVPRQYFWSVNIIDEFGVQYGSSGGPGDPTLGSYSNFGSAADALAGNSGSYDIYLNAGQKIGFYIRDENPRDNNPGSIAMNVSVAPEPVSTTLFIIGGLVLGGRSYLRRKNKLTN